MASRSLLASPSLSPFPFFPGTAPVARARAHARALRRSPLAVRGIVTKGFAVIPDLICMLMVMDVYLRSYSPVLSPPAIHSGVFAW